MTVKKWDVWNLDRETMAGLVVSEGVTEKEANADADKRNATAVRLKMPGIAFVALPQGRQPAESDLPPLPAAEKGELRADWARGQAGNGYLGVLTRQPHNDRYVLADGQKFLWSCGHVHMRHREAVACAQAELDRPWVQRMSREGHQVGRYSRIYWGKLRTSADPADRDLYLESDNGTSIVCFSPGDMPALRAAVLPESEVLKALQDKWSAKLGPGGRTAVAEGHMQGYRLGVGDMENTPVYRTAPADADAVISFLTGLAGTPAAIQGGKLDALGTVTEFLEQLKGQS
jgi:hypothetical protein